MNVRYQAMSVPSPIRTKSVFANSLSIRDPARRARSRHWCCRLHSVSRRPVGWRWRQPGQRQSKSRRQRPAPDAQAGLNESKVVDPTKGLHNEEPKPPEPPKPKDAPEIPKFKEKEVIKPPVAPSKNSKMNHPEKVPHPSKVFDDPRPLRITPWLTAKAAIQIFQRATHNARPGQAGSTSKARAAATSPAAMAGTLRQCAARSARIGIYSHRSRRPQRSTR